MVLGHRIAFLLSKQHLFTVYSTDSWSPCSILSNKTGALFTQMSRDHHIKLLLTKPAGSLPKWFITQTDKTRALFAHTHKKKKKKSKPTYKSGSVSPKEFIIRQAYWQNWSGIYPKYSPYHMLSDKTGVVFIQSIHHITCLVTKLERCSMLTDKAGVVFIQSIHHKVCLLMKLELRIPKGCTIYHAYWQSWSGIYPKYSP